MSLGNRLCHLQKVNREARALLNRLRAGCVSANVHLPCIGRVRHQTCSSRGVMESPKHDVRFYPALASCRAEQPNSLRKTGHACTSCTDFKFPTGSPALARQWFDLVLSYPYQIGLNRRL